MLLSSATLGNVKYEMTDIYPTDLPGMDRKPKMCYGYLRDLTHSKFSKEVNVSVDRHHSRKENSYRICTLATRSRAGQSNAAQSQARAADETPVLLISSLYTKRHPMPYPARNVVFVSTLLHQIRPVPMKRCHRGPLHLYSGRARASV